jgi:hypothetical protein
MFIVVAQMHDVLDTMFLAVWKEHFGVEVILILNKNIRVISST